MNIAHWLERAALAHPGRGAIWHGPDPVMDYAGFFDAARHMAGWLTARGVGPGDRVALFAQNCPEYLPALYGVWTLGAAVVPINSKLHGAEAAWIIADAGAVICLASPAQLPDLAEAGCAAPVVGIDAALQAARGAVPVDRIAPRGGDDLAWLFYTSGTTGRPKGVMITHRMLRTMALDYSVSVDHVSPADCALYAAPMSHGAGLYNVMHVLAGARHVIPASGGFDPAEIFDLAARFDRVHMFAAPTMVKRMVQVARATGADGRGLRSVVYGGGPMYLADILDAVDHFGPVFLQIYGQGECPMAITALGRDLVADRSHPRWRARLASVGVAQASVQLRIADGAGAELPRGEMGEICVRGDTVMPGYWQNPQASAQALAGGWLRTGDMGTMDADGYVTLQDRAKDMIISGGSNIYPREVEEALLTLPGVAEVAVVGAPDPDWGEVVVACVVPRPGVVLDPVTLDAACLAQIARFKRPKRYVMLPELPKNNYGKVLKTALRAQLTEAVE